VAFGVLASRPVENSRHKVFQLSSKIGKLIGFCNLQGQGDLRLCWWWCDVINYYRVKCILDDLEVLDE
jgi:hypothetical protein